MSRTRTIPALLALVLFATVPNSAVLAQGGKPAPDPAISWTCPMHPDVIETKESACPICKMNLVAQRLETVYTCPVHAVVVDRKAGKCPIDHQELIPLTVAVSYTCDGRASVNELMPGKCPDDSPMVVKYTPRPHGNHNPQHGGLFFMAPDNWHHIEGAYPRASVMRVYLYDDYTKPLPQDQARRVLGRVVTKETFDAATRSTSELASFPLVMAPNGRYLEARIDSKAAPARMTAKVKFKDNGPEYRFDFAFPQFSREPRPLAASPRSTSANKATAGPSPVMTIVDATAPASAPPGGSPDALAAGVDPSLIRLPIPDTVEEMVAQLKVRNEQILALIDKGAFADVYVPAFLAKDLALALEAHRAQLAPEKRELVTPPIRRLVESAWLLDAFGDLGNKQQITRAYSRFSSAVQDVQAVLR